MPNRSVSSSGSGSDAEVVQVAEAEFKAAQAAFEVAKRALKAARSAQAVRAKRRESCLELIDHAIKYRKSNRDFERFDAHFAKGGYVSLAEAVKAIVKGLLESRRVLSLERLIGILRIDRGFGVVKMLLSKDIATLLDTHEVGSEEIKGLINVLQAVPNNHSLVGGCSRISGECVSGLSEKVKKKISDFYGQHSSALTEACKKHQVGPFKQFELREFIDLILIFHNSGKDLCKHRLFFRQNFYRSLSQCTKSLAEIMLARYRPYVDLGRLIQFMKMDRDFGFLRVALLRDLALFLRKFDPKNESQVELRKVLQLPHNVQLLQGETKIDEMVLPTDLQEQLADMYKSDLEKHADVFQRLESAEAGSGASAGSVSPKPQKRPSGSPMGGLFKQPRPGQIADSVASGNGPAAPR